MSWDDVKPCWFTSWGTILPGFTVMGRFTLIPVQNLRFYVRAHACEGTHASTYTTLAPHSHTYVRDTCKFSDDSDVLVDFLRRNPDDLRASDRLPPRRSSGRGSPA